jgi:hypothetical protein
LEPAEIGLAFPHGIRTESIEIDTKTKRFMETTGNPESPQPVGRLDTWSFPGISGLDVQDWEIELRGRSGDPKAVFAYVRPLGFVKRRFDASVTEFLCLR